MERGGVTYQLITDHIGSVRLVVNTSTGAVAQRIDYDEFGRVVANTNPGFQPFAFAGGLYDDDSKLVRFGARDFDAETGRWTAGDPLGIGDGGENLYAYVGNSPLNAIDPTGLTVNCTYSQSTGELVCRNEEGETMSHIGYSGSPEGLNNPDMQHVANTGPIPRGNYKIEDCYTGEQFRKFGPDSRHDPALTLTPHRTNDMGGRNGFLIHEGNRSGRQTASEGCIIMPKWFRQWIQENGGGQLIVTR
jgi:RHS repeat-associated protein